MGGDGHALDEGERVALHQHAVGEGAAVALVGVAADELHVGLGLGDGPPLDAGGEAGTAPAAQARVDDCFDHGLGAHGQRGAQPDEAAVALVVVGRAGVDDADPGEGEALLATQPVEVLDGPEAGCGALQHPLADEAVDLLGLDRAVAHPTPVGLHLDERLEPEHAPRAGAHHLHVEATGHDHGRDPLGDLVGPDGAGRRVAGHEHPGGHRSPRMASRRAGVTLPRRTPSTCTDGPRAQLPRQKTSSSVTPPSSVVSPKPTPSATRAWSASASAPTDWHASARQMRTVDRPAGAVRKSS